jgi:hypothetical protein
MELSETQKRVMEYVLVVNELRGVRKRKRELEKYAKKVLNAELAVEVLQGSRDFQGVAMISTRSRRLLDARLETLGSLIGDVHQKILVKLLKEEREKLGEKYRLIRGFNERVLLTEAADMFPPIMKTAILFGAEIYSYHYDVTQAAEMGRVLMYKKSRKYFLKKLKDWSLTAVLRYVEETNKNIEELTEYRKAFPQEDDGQ